MNFDEAEREVLADLADVLIPAGDGRPSASQAEVAGQWLDAALTARPDLAQALKKLIKKPRTGTPHDIVADLRANDPSAFEVLAEVVPGAYFMNPDVRTAIGYSGQDRREIDPHPDYMDDGLLESVIRRGPIYRATPEKGQ